MRTVIGVFAIFTATIFFLSIEIGKKPIFSHIYNVISPATKGAQNLAESLFGNSVDKTQKFSKDLFDNSTPRMKDSVKSKMSSLKNHKGLPQEQIPERDRKKLDELIKSH
jgi:hypothetical protein